MPTPSEVDSPQRRAKSGFILPAVVKELGNIARWGIPAFREKIFVREKTDTTAREDKIARGIEALGVFHDNLRGLIGNPEEPD
ncbi:MAG TPA: hypothetical protein VF820_06850, partial [Patescibacteria group bacterium]